jgi:thymidylate synthase
VAWKEDRDKWEKFLRDGVFSYSYAERWQYQLPYVIRELKARPNSRQAIMTMYDVHQDMMNWGGRDRVPCSLSYQFLLRDDKLTLIYTQRSCDFLSFFATDVYLSVRLLQHVAAEIDATPVRFIHQIGSLHAFAKDLEGRGIF